MLTCRSHQQATNTKKHHTANTTIIMQVHLSAHLRFGIPRSINWGRFSRYSNQGNHIILIILMVVLFSFSFNLNYDNSTGTCRGLRGEVSWLPTFLPFHTTMSFSSCPSFSLFLMRFVWVRLDSRFMPRQYY